MNDSARVGQDSAWEATAGRQLPATAPAPFLNQIFAIYSTVDIIGRGGNAVDKNRSNGLIGKRVQQIMKRLLSACCCIFLLSCGEDSLGLKSIPIDSKVIIETREILGPSSRRLTFLCKTEKIYPCFNYPLLTEEHSDENSFQITFTSVGETDLCATALGPATKTIDLNAVSNGEYELELNNDKLKNNGKLKVSDTEISLEFGQKNGIDFARTNTRRVPNKTYWGTIGYHVQSSSSIADEFMQKFEDAGAIFNKQSPGHYFYYEIDNSGDIIANVESSGYYFMKAFIFQYDGDEAKLRDLVKVDGKQYHENLSIKLETYKGERFYNWGN